MACSAALQQGSGPCEDLVTPADSHEAPGLHYTGPTLRWQPLEGHQTGGRESTPLSEMLHEHSGLARGPG